MKKQILILGLLTLSLVSCNKNEDSKMMKQNYATDTKIMEISYPYIAEDKSRAKATFKDDGKAKTIIIEANNMKYVLDFKQATPTGEIYERNSISAEASEDSLLISQGNNVIHLGKVK